MTIVIAIVLLLLIGAVAGAYLAEEAARKAARRAASATLVAALAAAAPDLMAVELAVNTYDHEGDGYSYDVLGFGAFAEDVRPMSAAGDDRPRRPARAGIAYVVGGRFVSLVYAHEAIAATAT